MKSEIKKLTIQHKLQQAIHTFTFFSSFFHRIIRLQNSIVFLALADICYNSISQPSIHGIPQFHVNVDIKAQLCFIQQLQKNPQQINPLH